MGRIKDRVGEINYNTFGSKMIIKEYRNKNNIDVYFPKYNWIKYNSTYQHFKNGLIKCPYEPRVYNRGYIGVGKYIPMENKKTYELWLNMLKRCYSDKVSAKNSTYKKSEVFNEWLNFQNFAEWYYENYYEIEGENMHLDKDILVKGNKIYSPSTCIFVPERINKLFENITFNPKIQNGKYVVRLRRKDDIKYLGRFETKEEAFQIYKKEKEKYIKQVADEYKPYIPRELYDAMYKYEVDINN